MSIDSATSPCRGDRQWPEVPVSSRARFPVLVVTGETGTKYLPTYLPHVSLADVLSSDSDFCVLHKRLGLSGRGVFGRRRPVQPALKSIIIS